MEKLEYVIEDSTIAEILGIQNFSNEESAVLELIKNAYDAQAANVIVIISKDRIVVEDDGVGMNRQKILDAWMHIGKSDKEYIMGKGGSARVLAGSKGVGRFAIARLGARDCVLSKMDGQDSVLWKTDWNTNTLETYRALEKSGTRIEIENLRDNWTESRVRNLRDFLSRTYNDDKMRIQVEYKKNRQNVTKYFNKIQLGINCVSIIRLHYSSDSQMLVCDIESDEFKEAAKAHCPGMNLEAQRMEINMADELADIKEEVSEGAADEEWRELLTSVGNFSAELYFFQKDWIIWHYSWKENIRLKKMRKRNIFWEKALVYC